MRTNRVPIQVVRDEWPPLAVALLNGPGEYASSGTVTMLWYQPHTKRQRKCRMTTKIPLTFREPIWCHDDADLGGFRGVSPNSPPH